MRRRGFWFAAGRASGVKGPVRRTVRATTRRRGLSPRLTLTVPVHVPRGCTGRRDVPLVLNLHGSGSNGRKQLTAGGLDETADRHGFLAAAPDGGVRRPGTPDGCTRVIPGAPDTSGQYPSPDVGFLADTIEAMSARLRAADDRVHATGFSGGAR
ncbi:hypothetical protein IAG44_40855 [Streptomyces roseirectus]|uniref:Polyhydroxybutyrate depolymerase n=1 Tax=Streptomyces roseirectus TaxID=2768066 RepID=A0A7H0IQS1_9ACTN|nr:hypothetical protein [Streptomyces roseirectus]QNP75137.1 hypothetical protein IAG44_40855 [Streptomyces roseirectus]